MALTSSRIRIDFAVMYTAVTTKVVPQKRNLGVRDNAD